MNPVANKVAKVLAEGKGGTAVVDWRRDAPLLEHVALGDLALIDEPQTREGAQEGDYENLGYRVLVYGRGGPLVLERRTEERVAFHLLFNSDRSTMPYRAGFPMGAPGLAFFRSLMFINVIGISLFGLAYFASAITEEKEEYVLGLLRMTKLSAVSILLGKSTSRMIGAMLLLLSQMPFTFLAVTLGGVSTRQVLAAYATLLAYVLLLSGLGLFCSVKRSPAA